MSTVEEKSTNDSDKISSTQAPKKQISVQKIFVKGLVFEAALIVSENVKNAPDPNIEMQAAVNSDEREDKTAEVILTLNLTAKVNGSLLWRIQLQHAGFYVVQGFNEEQKKQIFNGYCANQLYQYASVIVNNTVTQGGFSPVFLAPLNFEALYQQQLKQEAKQTMLSSTIPAANTVGQH